MGKTDARRILIVDDSVEVRSFLTDLLKEEGYAVFQASNGKEGQEFLRKNAIDLIITVLVMPEQEGLETIRSIRRNWPQIPVIAMSGNHNYLDVARKLGAQAVFPKPIETASILEEVRKLASHQG
jgi:DNA-binding response OmpR family regulator